MNKVNFINCINTYKEKGTPYTVKGFAEYMGLSLYKTKQYMKQFNVETKDIRCVDKLDYTDDDLKPLATGSITAPDKLRPDLVGQRFVFTAAQNNTHLHEGFFASLLNFCEHKGAQLQVSRFSYNKSGFLKTKDAEGLWYDKRLDEYFNDTDCKVTDDLIFCGSLDILPTQAKPTTGLLSYTQSSSGIVPHAKVQMLSCPVFKGNKPKFLYSTGAITQRNYIDRRLGQIASFHHVFGALYVEIDEDGEWFARQLIADEEGVFHDLDERFTPEGVESGVRVEAINWGDIHSEKIDTDVAYGGWLPDPISQHTMVTNLMPRYQFIHDLSDFTARNHHNRNDPYFLAEMMREGTDTVEGGLLKAYTVLETMKRARSQIVVVHSNHDAALKRWMNEASVRQDPKNARFWHEMNAEMYRRIERGETDFDPFAWWMLEKAPRLGSSVTFLKPDQSFKVKGIECGMHGHLGVGGRFGSPQQFKNLDTKCNTGHTHSAGIIDGVFTAGVSGKMDMGYNQGPSTWSHSHILTYANGRRAIVTMRGNKWRS